MDNNEKIKEKDAALDSANGVSLKAEPAQAATPEEVAVPEKKQDAIADADMEALLLGSDISAPAAAPASVISKESKAEEKPQSKPEQKPEDKPAAKEEPKIAPAAKEEAKPVVAPAKTEPASDKKPETPAAPAANAEQKPAAKEEAKPAAASAKAEPAPQYGAPQALFEDTIPLDYLRGETDAKAPAKEEPKKEEPKKEEPKKEEKQEAPKKKKDSEAEKLLAEVEAELAARDKKPQPAPEQNPAPAPEKKPAAPAPAPVVAAVAPVAEQKEEEEPKEEQTVGFKKKKRERSPEEEKLRNEYKMNDDFLLEDNDAIPGFVLAKGENLIRSYQCFASCRGTGNLCLTNKRLLVDADDRAEIELGQVNGTRFMKETQFYFFKLLFGLIFLGIGGLLIFLTFSHDGSTLNIPFITGDAWKSWYTYLFYGCGGLGVILSLPLLLTMVRRFFYFYIYTGQTSMFVESKSPSYVKLEEKNKEVKFILSTAGKDCEKAARELGALIIEAKAGRYDY